MLKNFPLFRTLANQLGKKSEASEAAIDIWRYAEPAGEEAEPLKRNVLQWRRLITSVREPVREFPGQAVDVVGFVHRPLPLLPNRFVLARHIIRCCLADTVPLGLVVHTLAANQYSTGQWLRVQGTFGTVPDRQRSTLVVFPSSITPMSEPEKVYINGVF